MPLDVARLRRSKAWLKAKRRKELAFYIINLWTGCWHEVPAASVEDDDDFLADLAMCDPAAWDEVREDVLHGFIRCSDGRLYHPVVAEKAKEAWAAKQERRRRDEHERDRKRVEREDRKRMFDRLRAAGQVPPWNTNTSELRRLVQVLDGTCPPDRSDTPPGQSTHGPDDDHGRSRLRQGEGQGYGQGQGQGQDTSGANAPGADAPPATKKSKARNTDPVKQEIWDTGMRLLWDGEPGTRDKAAGFLTKLVREYGQPVTLEAVRAGAEALGRGELFEAESYLQACCLRATGRRLTPVANTRGARAAAAFDDLDQIERELRGQTNAGQNHAADSDFIDVPGRVVG